jgi:hypothetical protein
MSASVKGKQVVWGVQDDVRDLALIAATAGIVTAFSMSNGGATTPITDEQDDIVTRVDHAPEVKITMEVLAMSASTLPAKGDELDFGVAEVDGVDFTTGSVVVDDAKADYGPSGAKKYSISATFHPSVIAPVS